MVAGNLSGACIFDRVENCGRYAHRYALTIRRRRRLSIVDTWTTNADASEADSEEAWLACAGNQIVFGGNDETM